MIHNERGGLRIRSKILAEFGRMGEMLDLPAEISGELSQRFDLRPDGSIKPRSRKLIFDWKDARGPDGFKLDQRGRLYVAAGLNVALGQWRGLQLAACVGKPFALDEIVACVKDITEAAHT